MEIFSRESIGKMFEIGAEGHGAWWNVPDINLLACVLCAYFRLFDQGSLFSFDRSWHPVSEDSRHMTLYVGASVLSPSPMTEFPIFVSIPEGCRARLHVYFVVLFDHDSQTRQ